MAFQLTSNVKKAKKSKGCGTNHSYMGFTLLELAVVVAIVAIISTISVPWLISMRTRSGIRADARDVHSTFRMAQSAAVKTNEDVCVDIDVGAGTYALEGYFDGYFSTWSEGKLRPGNFFDLSTANYFTVATLPCFNPRGLPDPRLVEEKSLEIKNATNSLAMEVRLTPAGHVKSTDVP